MEDLIDKYKKDELSSEELLQLRKLINEMPDDEVEKRLYLDWLADDVDISKIDEEQMLRIKQTIEVGKVVPRTTRTWFIRWGQIAVAILLPVFMLLSVYLYIQKESISSTEMMVSTAKGEKATVTLPDGTTVMLNAESQLSYSLKDFNTETRAVAFQGEGYFKVHKNADNPFLVNVRGLQIKVLGTTFNLLVRETAKSAELVLEEGKVQFCCTKNDQSVILHPGQKAVLDYQTNAISVADHVDVAGASAWRFGEMVFRNTELWDVIEEIKNIYDMNIVIEKPESLHETFTGVLPTNNLNSVLEILEITCNMKASIRGQKIYLEIE